MTAPPPPANQEAEEPMMKIINRHPGPQLRGRGMSHEPLHPPVKLLFQELPALGLRSCLRAKSPPDCRWAAAVCWSDTETHEAPAWNQSWPFFLPSLSSRLVSLFDHSLLGTKQCISTHNGQNQASRDQTEALEEDKPGDSLVRLDKSLRFFEALILLSYWMGMKGTYSWSVGVLIINKVLHASAWHGPWHS